MAHPTTAPLPAYVASLLWDVDATAVDSARHGDFVIGRVLSAGTLDALRWVRSRYGDDCIREWISRHEGRQLSGPQLRFWQTVIGLPDDQVDRWLAAPERRLWEDAVS